MKRLAFSLAALLLPTTATAQVCASARPGWDGAPVGAAAEAFNLFTSPAGLVLIGISVIALRFRSQWIGLATVLLWTVFITVVTMADPTGQRIPAMAEGCIGPPTLFIVLAAAICVAIVLWTKPRSDSNSPPEA